MGIGNSAHLVGGAVGILLGLVPRPGPTEAGTQTGYRPVEVRMKKSGLKARAEKEYYP